MEKSVLVFSLNACETYELVRPVNGAGGWQNFLRKMQKQTKSDDNTVLIYMGDEDIGRVMRGMTGSGGFQGRLKKIFAAQIINFLEKI